MCLNDSETFLCSKQSSKPLHNWISANKRDEGQQMVRSSFPRLRNIIAISLSNINLPDAGGDTQLSDICIAATHVGPIPLLGRLTTLCSSIRRVKSATLLPADSREPFA